METGFSIVIFDVLHKIQIIENDSRIKAGFLLKKACFCFTLKSKKKLNKIIKGRCVYEKNYNTSRKS